MLAASALIMVILGAGVCFALIGQDDPEPEMEEQDAEMPVDPDDDLTFLAIEDMFGENVGDVPAEDANADDDLQPSAEEPQVLFEADSAEVETEAEVSPEDEQDEPTEATLYQEGLAIR